MIEPSAAQVSTSWLTLRRDGVMVVFDVSGPHLPRIVYWGADLGDLIASEFAQLPAAEYTTPTADTRDADVPVTVLPSRAQGWPGWPGLTGHRDGLAPIGRQALRCWRRQGPAASWRRCRSHANDG